MRSKRHRSNDNDGNQILRDGYDSIKSISEDQDRETTREIHRMALQVFNREPNLQELRRGSGGLANGDLEEGRHQLLLLRRRW